MRVALSKFVYFHFSDSFLSRSHFLSCVLLMPRMILSLIRVSWKQGQKLEVCANFRNVVTTSRPL